MSTNPFGLVVCRSPTTYARSEESCPDVIDLFYPVNFTHNEQFGADKIPPRGAALDASAVADHDALLDRISNKIVERRELVLSPLGEPTSHEQQMWKICTQTTLPRFGPALTFSLSSHCCHFRRRRDPRHRRSAWRCRP